MTIAVLFARWPASLKRNFWKNDAPVFLLLFAVLVPERNRGGELYIGGPKRVSIVVWGKASKGGIGGKRLKELPCIWPKSFWQRRVDLHRTPLAVPLLTLLRRDSCQRGVIIIAVVVLKRKSNRYVQFQNLSFVDCYCHCYLHLKHVRPNILPFPTNWPLGIKYIRGGSSCSCTIDLRGACVSTSVREVEHDKFKRGRCTSNSFITGHIEKSVVDSTLGHGQICWVVGIQKIIVGWQPPALASKVRICSNITCNTKT